MRVLIIISVNDYSVTIAHIVATYSNCTDGDVCLIGGVSEY